MDPKQALNVRLKPRGKDQMPANRTIFGRVLDPQKRPVAGAAVTMNGISMSGGTTYGAMAGRGDEVAVTDASGEFEICATKPFDSADLQIDGPGVTRTRFAAVRPGGTRHDLALPPGAALVGRVVRDGKPVPGINIGVASVDRGAGTFTGDFVVGTDTNGVFVFPNLPSGREYEFYGVMDSLRGIGALAARVIRVGKDGSRTDLGTLSLSPGWRLAGEVRVAGATALPIGSRLILNRDAWDFSVIDLPADGHFDIPNVPGESVSLTVGMQGYRAAGKGPVLGRLEADRTGLVLMMERVAK